MKTKYNSDFPLLAEGWAREGLNDMEIMKKLGISKKTFYEYVKKYSDFRNSLKKGKAPVDTLVENALLKRCLGYEFPEVTEEIKTDGKGNILFKHKKKTPKHYPPDVGAIQTWLSNRKNHKWKRNPDLQKFKDDTQMVDYEVVPVASAKNKNEN